MRSMSKDEANAHSEMIGRLSRKMDDEEREMEEHYAMETLQKWRDENCADSARLDKLERMMKSRAWLSGELRMNIWSGKTIRAAIDAIKED